MFKVNGIEMKWKNSFSIGELLQEIKDNKEILPLAGYVQIVIVNGEILSSVGKNDYIINMNDEIKILPLMGGG